MIGMNNIPAWVSAGAATLSFIFTVVSWCLSNKSKKAKEKAEAAHQATLETCAAAQRSAKATEEQVLQAQKLFEQMQQLVAEQQSQSQSQSKIAASLQSPPFELTSTGSYHYLLRNTTTETLKILEVVNRGSFIKWDDEWYGLNDPFPWELHPDQSSEVYLPRSASVLNLELKVEGKDNSIFITIPK